MILPLLGGMGALALAYSSLVEPRWLQHVRFDLALPGLPAALDGFKAHLVADLHSTKYAQIERMIHERLMAEPVDAIFALGDFIWLNSDIKYALKVFEGLPSRLGIFGILGNAEHKRRVPTGRIVERLNESGIRMLMNESVIIEHNDQPVQLIGVDDPYTGHARLKEAIQSVSPPAEHGVRPYRILLAHAPQMILDPGTQEIDLVFSGHTHGGQIRLPLVGALLGHSRWEYLLSAGLYRPEKLQKMLRAPKAPTLYVSRGIGTGFIHFRFLCRPEITTVTLRAVHHEA